MNRGTWVPYKKRPEFDEFELLLVSKILEESLYYDETRKKHISPTFEKLIKKTYLNHKEAFGKLDRKSMYKHMYEYRLPRIVRRVTHIVTGGKLRINDKEYARSISKEMTVREFMFYLDKRYQEKFGPIELKKENEK